jgi:hypothetical protein
MTKRKKDRRNDKAKPKAVGSGRSLTPSLGIREWKITARPDADYDCFDIGMRAPNGDVTLVAHTNDENAANLLVAAGVALAASKGSVRDEMDRLHSSLRGILDRWPYGLVNEHLLPERMVDNLYKLDFLAHAVLPAQKAQRATGVPASLLIALAMMEYGGAACDIGVLESSTFNIGPEVGIYAWFLGVGNHLAKTAALRPVIAAAGDRAAFLDEILKCKAWKPEFRADLTQEFIDHDLHECDWTSSDEERDRRQPFVTTLSYKERLAIAQEKKPGAQQKLRRAS